MRLAIAILLSAALVLAACTSDDSSGIETPSTTAAPLTTLAPPGGTSSTTTTVPAPDEPTTTTVPPPSNECVVGTDTSVEGFTVSCTVLGLTIRAAEDVDGDAVTAQAERVYQMLIFRPDLTAAIVEAGLEGRVIPDGVRITNVPAFEELYELYPGIDWNRRGRSFPGNVELPLFAGAEENLLCLEEPYYFGEDEFVRAFALTIRRFGLDVVDEPTSEAIEVSYARAIAAGLWKNTLAEINSDEYWVEGVQSYFDANLEDNAEDREPNSSHNAVNTRDELRDYDPALWTVAQSVFGETEWRPAC
jgi:hypothetical protein